MANKYLDCLGHKIWFEASVPDTSIQWDNAKCILWDDNLALSWEREAGQFFLRPKLSGKITIIGELAKAIMQMSSSNYAYLYLHEAIQSVNNYPLTVGRTFNKYLTFRFAKSDCNIKSTISQIQPGTDGESFVENYILEVNPEVVDQYTNILNNLDKEYDLIKLITPKKSLTYYRRPCLQLYIQNTGYLGHFLGGNYWETEVSSSGILATNRRFAKVFSARFIRVTSSLPSVVGIDLEGDYYADCTNPSTSYPDRLSPVPNRYNYYMYKDNDVNTGKALHITLWGGQDNQTLQIAYAENIGGTWMDLYTIVPGQNAPNGYDYFEWGDPYSLVSNRSIDFVTADSRVTCTQTDKIYYGRWYLPTDSFGGRTTYAKASDDPTVGEDVVGYKYLAYAQTTDLSIGFGIQNTTPGQWGRNDDGLYFHPPGGVDNNAYVPLLQSSWDNQSIWLRRSSFNLGIETQGREIVTMNDAYDIADVLKVLFGAASTTNTSGFPTQFEIDLSNCPSPVTVVNVTPKSNITRGLYTLAAQKAPTTLRSFLDMLRNLFNVYWYIDDTDYPNRVVFGTRQALVTENSSGMWLDLYDPSGGDASPRNSARSWGFNKQEVKYDKTELPERQQFKWMDKSTDLFNYPILVNVGAMVKPDEVDEVSIGDFTADLDYMVISGKECSSEGFALITDQSTPENVVYFGANYAVSNPALTIIRLINLNTRGLRQERPTSIYKYLYDPNNTQYSSASVAYSATQETTAPVVLIGNIQSIEYPNGYVQSVIDLWKKQYSTINTNRGLGRIRKISVNLSSRFAKITLEQRPQ